MKWNAMVLGVVAMVACGGNKDTETDTDTDTADTDTDTDADTDTDTDADTDADTDTDTDTDTDADTDTHTGHTGWVDTAAMQYDLMFDGTGYGPHDGQTIYFDIRIPVAPFTAAATDSMVMDSTGEIHMNWRNILADGVSYVVAFYADMNADGTCTSAGGADHAWLVPVNPDKGGIPRAVTADQAVVFDHVLPGPTAGQACTLANLP